MNPKVLNFSYIVVYLYFFSCFQNNVEIHVAHIQSGLSQLGNLHAFAANNTNAVWAPAATTTTHRGVDHFDDTIFWNGAFTWTVKTGSHGCFRPPPSNRNLCVPVKQGIVLTGGGRYFTHPFYCTNMLVQPIEHKPERVLNCILQIHISKVNGYLLVSCAKHRLLQFL